MPKQDPRKQALQEFVEWWRKYCQGKEKSEAQIFLDHLFQAVGHEGGALESAELEFHFRTEDSASFADLVWKPVVLIEMKSRGESLDKHYGQALRYWIQLAPNRPEYVILCNFDEIWIYDLNRQLDDPVDQVAIEELPDRFHAIGFLFKQRKPEVIFRNNLVAVTQRAAKQVGKVFKSLTERGIDVAVAQRFVLQSVVAMFAEDIGLLPDQIFTALIRDCRENDQSSYDLLGGLFSQMNEPEPAPAGRFQGVGYFDGGLFQEITALELTDDELSQLEEACKQNWTQVKPEIFGSLFEASTDPAERHKGGMHFTSGSDIQKIVLPTITLPLTEWVDNIDSAEGVKGFLESIRRFKVLDPACGSGNFLYIAYRELRRLEKYAQDKLLEMESDPDPEHLHRHVTAKQFFGIDTNPFGVELAKVTLMIARKLTIDELDLEENPLPLDNLDDNIFTADALFCEWPTADVIIGNPPYQSKNKMTKEFGREYVNEVRTAYPEISGLADYCVYWFRKAHDQLPQGGRAGLVGTNTVTQTYSRESGLDYITENGGTIIEAHANQPWSGESSVSVAIVNWVKGKYEGTKELYEVINDEVVHRQVDHIPSTLSTEWDVTDAVDLVVNVDPKICYQGLTPGHSGFVLDPEEYRTLIGKSDESAEVLYPYLSGQDMLDNPQSKPSRYIIDFQERDITEANQYHEVFKHVEERVLPDRKTKAEEQLKTNERLRAKNPKARINTHHISAYEQWWKLFYNRTELISKLESNGRYIACSRVTKRPIFEFLSTNIRPSDALQAFALFDDYSFGILHSSIHWKWFRARCSTLEGRPRYTSNQIFSTFPWPQRPSQQDMYEVAEAARALLRFRNKGIHRSHSLRDLYRTLDKPGKNPLRDLHFELDQTVLKAYDFSENDDVLKSLLELNFDIAEQERNEQGVVGPGPRLYEGDLSDLVSQFVVTP